jgi:hypothetical protein
MYIMYELCMDVCICICIHALCTCVVYVRNVCMHGLTCVMYVYVCTVCMCTVCFIYCIYIYIYIRQRRVHTHIYSHVAPFHPFVTYMIVIQLQEILSAIYLM